jgi:hypothetical protein
MANTKTKEEVPTKENTALTTAEETAVAVPSNDLQIDAEDIDIQRLNVVQKTSNMDFEHGSLVLDKTHELLPRETKGKCIVLGAIKKWKEDIDFDSDEMPQIVGTKAEAEALNASSEYDILEFAEIILMFPQPEGNEDDEAFPFPIGDENYAMGKIYVQKDAYRKTYKSLMTFAAFNRGLPLNSRYWNFESQIISKGKYSWYVPTLAVTKEHVPAAVSDFANSFAL